LTTSRADYVPELLAALWPPPAKASRPGRLARPVAGRTELVAFPSAGRPVLLLPRRPRRAAAAALRHYKASARSWDRLRLRCAAAAAGTGLARALPGRISIEPAGARPAASVGDAPDIGGYLRARLRPDVLLSVFVPPPRANRKPVLLALAPDGSPLGFVKVGISALTSELVRTEAAALTALADGSLTRLRPPRLLHHGQWRGCEVLVQEPLGAGRPGPATAGLLAGAMTELAGVAGTERQPAAQSSYWQRLRARLEELTAGPARSADRHRQQSAGQVLRALCCLEPAGSAPLSFGAWHGDWTPWNMTVAAGRVLAWDWERFECGVPVGFDAVHYRLQAAVVRGRADPAAAADQAVASAARTLAPMGVPPAEAGLVAALYLAEICTRYLADGQAETGPPLGRVDGWLLPALVRHAGLISRRPPG
jgi:hypothetical protein